VIGRQQRTEEENAMSTVSGQRARVAAIYARVSSERQRQEQTIASQTAGLRELAAQRGLIVGGELVFEDDGFSGASLQRPALERLRDRAAEGAFEVVLCHAPDRLARRYAYQVLLLEELARAGVEIVFAKASERSGSPEDELLRQFQGMIAEYERAQIAERTRRGKQHRARQGSHAVLSAAPYGYRYVKKTEHADGFYEIDPVQGDVVRHVFERYAHDGLSIGAIAKWLTAERIPTRTGKQTWDRSTVWGMLKNPAYQGQAGFGKTASSGQPGKATRTTRARGERHGRRPTRTDTPPQQWTTIAVPAIVDEQTFALAQQRLIDNKRFAARNAKTPGLLTGLVVCRHCGYALYRTATRTSAGNRISYYRCTGADGWRHPGGRVCDSRPVRADELEPLVWDQTVTLLKDPTLVQAEIDRRFAALRTEHPAARRQDALQRDLTHAQAATARLIEAYQEQLITLDELRARMPDLRKRETTLTAQLDALTSELHDAETYLKIADTLDGLRARVDQAADQLTTEDRQRLLQLVVREVRIGTDDITIRHTIPTPSAGPDPPSCPLRGSGHRRPLRSLHDRCARQAPVPSVRAGCGLSLRAAARDVRG
jgi:site-specific DNA recombinase